MINFQFQKIYKYISLSGEFGRDAIKNAIEKNRLYWQSPVLFNDPFDCYPVLYFGESKKDTAAFNKRAVKIFGSGKSRIERRKDLKNLAAYPVTEMEQKLQEGWIKSLSESSIACFSEVEDDPLMWAHYADSHKGVCLVFEEIAGPQTNWFALPVTYQKSRPRLNLTSFNNPEMAMQAICLKSDHWSYEREKRMVEWGKAPGYRNFPASQLKGIILGARIGGDDEAFVLELLKKHRPELEVHRATIDDIQFKLNIITAGHITPPLTSPHRKRTGRASVRAWPCWGRGWRSKRR
jgi:hypothetical protein